MYPSISPLILAATVVILVPLYSRTFDKISRIPCIKTQSVESAFHLEVSHAVLFTAVILRAN